MSQHASKMSSKFLFSRMFWNELELAKNFKNMIKDGVISFSFRDLAASLILASRSALLSEAKLRREFWIPLASLRHSIQID